MKRLSAFVLVLCCATGVTLGASAAWNVDADGDWTNNANWTPMDDPNAAGEIATFGDIATARRNINLDAPITVGGLVFDSSLDLDLSFGLTDPTWSLENNGITFNNGGLPVVVDAQDSNPGDAVLYRVTGGITSTSGFVKTGGGIFNIHTSNPNLAGNVQIDQGSILAGPKDGSGAPNNDVLGTANVVLNGGALTVRWRNARNFGNDISVIGNSTLTGFQTSSQTRSDATWGDLDLADGVTLTYGAGNNDYFINGTTTLIGDATINRSGGNGLATLTGQITGTGQLTVTGANPLVLDGTATNTYSGGTVIGTAGNAGHLAAWKDDALGTGDVIVNPLGQLDIAGGSDNESGDTAFSVVNGAIDDAANVDVFSDAGDFGEIFIADGIVDTISLFRIDGSIKALGTWGSSSSPAMFVNDDIFSGQGVLLVTEVPEPTAAALLGLGAVALIHRRRRHN